MRYLFGFLLLTALFISCNNSSQSAHKSDATFSAPDSQAVQPASARYDVFGLNISNLDVHNYKIKKNESLYNILDHWGFSPKQIYSITKKAKKVIDVRAFRPGQHYRVYTSKGNDKKLKKLVWQPNAVDFVVFNWQPDSLRIFKASRVMSQKTEKAEGVIHHSLYQALRNENASPVLVSKISDILNWEVNMYSLQKGDRFKVLYDDKYVDDQFYGVGNILAIKLTHAGKTYTAYKFHQGSIDGYFNAQGQSVQKALRKFPFKHHWRITSRFSMHRMNPVLHRVMPHLGVDIGAPYGTPVLSAGDGTVIEAHYGGPAGNIVKIRHNRTYTTVYMHLEKFAHGIHRGTHVNKGEVIGYVGDTGRSTGTHLHYGVFKHHHAVNPLTVKLPSAKSVPDSDMNNFRKIRNQRNAKLNNQDSMAVAVASS